MFGLLFVGSLIYSCFKGIKDSFEPTIPAENWANKDLYHEDMMNGVSTEQLMKNVRNGKYKLTEQYPEPHRDPVSGKIIIENCLLYNSDLKEHGAYQTMKWVKQGKYNLTQEELEVERERIQREFDRMTELYRGTNRRIK